MNPYSLFKYVPMSVLRALAHLVAWGMKQFPNLKLHRTINTNLSLAYPNLSPKQKQALHHAIVTNQALSSVESIKSWAMPPNWSIQQIKQVHDPHILQAGLNNPNGMLAIVPHLGTWEIMNAWLNQFGSPTIMYKPVKGRLSNEFVLQGRQRLNATLVPTDATGVKSIFKTLKQGGFSIVLPDHVPDPTGGVVVPFFGIPTLSSTLAPKLASKTGCALVGLACIRRTDGNGFDVHCYELNQPALYDKDSTVATTALNHAMQTMITPLSEHYMWGYRRFKYVPNIDDVYQANSKQLNALTSTLTSKFSDNKSDNKKD